MNNSNVKQKLEIDNVGKYSLDTIKSYFDANRNLWDTNPAICLAREYYKGKLVGLRVAELLDSGHSHRRTLISISRCHVDDYMDSIIRALFGCILNIKVVENRQGSKVFVTDKTRLEPWSDIFVPLKFNLSDKKYTGIDYIDFTEKKYMSALLHRYEAIYKLVNLREYIKPIVFNSLSIESEEESMERPGYFYFLKDYRQLLQELNQN